jgi:hypothetical protein
MPAPDTVATNQSTLLAWRGLYEDGRWHTITRLDTSGGVLRMGTTPVRTLRNGAVLLGNQETRLGLSADGKTRTLRAATSDGDSVVWTWRASETWQPDAAALQTYEGRYRNEEIGVTFTVRVVNGALTVSPRPGVTDTLVPTVRDAFDGDGGAVWFTRKKGGAIAEMHFGESRVWDFVAGRVP